MMLSLLRISLVASTLCFNCTTFCFTDALHSNSLGSTRFQASRVLSVTKDPTSKRYGITDCCRSQGAGLHVINPLGPKKSKIDTDISSARQGLFGKPPRKKDKIISLSSRLFSGLTRRKYLSFPLVTLMILTIRARPASAFFDLIPKTESFSFAALGAFYESMPYTSAFVTCGLKASAADYIAQRKARTCEIDFRRNKAFLLYGGFYLGIFQYFLYNKVFPFLFGTGSSFEVVSMKVFVDMLVIAPFLCMPLAYVTKSLVQGESIRKGLSKYWSEVKNGLLLKCWRLWIPVQTLTFSVVPEHLRIMFIALVSFFWTIILSSISSGHDTNGDRCKL